jgi:hypothetical protein
MRRGDIESRAKLLTHCGGLRTVGKMPLPEGRTAFREVYPFEPPSWAVGAWLRGFSSGVVDGNQVSQGGLARLS